MPEKVKDKLEFYELAVVLRPELEADLAPAQAKIAKIIADADGEIASAAEFARQELAYKIKGETHGLYGYYRLNLPADAPNKIAAVLNITDEVLRYLLTKVDAKAEAYLAEEAKRKREHREEVERDEAAGETDSDEDSDSEIKED